MILPTRALFPFFHAFLVRSTYNSFWRYVSLNISELELIKQSLLHTDLQMPFFPLCLIHGDFTHPGSQISDFGVNLYSSHFLSIGSPTFIVSTSKKFLKSDFPFSSPLLLSYSVLPLKGFDNFLIEPLAFGPFPYQPSSNILQIKHSSAPKLLVVLLRLPGKR